MSKHTPVEVKKLNGTFRDDRHLPDYARLPVVENTPYPPPTLPEKAHPVWYAQVTAMQQMRTLTEADFVLLEAFCYQKYLYDKAVKELANEDLIDETNNGSTKMVSLYIKIQNDAIANMMNLSKKLGFSPLDRTGIGVKDSSPNDPLSGLLKKK
jgi:P27 family predicted phage terminase small subunit